MDYFKGFGVEVGQGRYHEEAIYGIALVYTQLFNKISENLQKHGLTPAKMNVLMIIKHQGKDQGISQMEIGRRMMVSASNMSRVLDKLLREGLVNRSASVEDKRFKVIKITAKGSALLDKAWPGYTACLQELAASLPMNDQKLIAVLLQQWLGRLVG